MVRAGEAGSLQIAARPAPAALQRAALSLVLAAAALPRIWAAIDDQSIWWPDEIYQSLEPAHRLVFGHGIVAWEFAEGARSWLFPGALALLLAAGDLIGLHSGLSLVAFCKLAMVALGLIGLWASIRLAERLAGPLAGWLSAALGAVFPALLVFGTRCTSETASASLLVVAAYLATTSTRRSMWAAGMIAGISVFVRYQNGLVLVGILLWVCSQHRWRNAVDFAVAATVAGLAGGLLDWATWGSPFHSFLKYLQFNLVEGKAARWGTAPWHFYLVTLWTGTGPAMAGIALGFILAARRAMALVVIVSAYLAIHMAVPHKEYRFLMPILPLGLTVAGVGLAWGIERLRPRPRLVAGVLGVALAVGMIHRSVTVTLEDLGKGGGTPSAGDSPWHRNEGPNLMLSKAGEQPDLCGVVVVGIDRPSMGGYSYLHRPVPILRPGAPAVVERANYALAPLSHPVPAGYKQVAAGGGWGLFRRDGTCVPGAFDYRL